MSFNILVFTFGFHTYLGHVTSSGNKKCLRRSKKVNCYNVEKGKKYNQFLESGSLEHARRINTLGKMAFAGSMTIFNVIFWIAAFKEHLRPADEYISE